MSRSPGAGHITGEAVLPLLAKVPKITAYFWIIQIFTTGMAETLSDYLVTQCDPVTAVVLAAGLVLPVVIVVQFRTRACVTWSYWSTVVVVGIVGSMVTDVVHVVLSVSYLGATIR